MNGQRRYDTTGVAKNPYSPAEAVLGSRGCDAFPLTNSLNFKSVLSQSSNVGDDAIEGECTMQPANTKPWRRIVLPLAGLLFVLFGCNTGQTVELQARSRTHVSDVPEPNGFDLVEKRSRSYRNQTGLRWVDYLYKGREDKFNVVHFYEKQMTLYHWEPQTAQTAQGQISLDFTKDHERCRITVSGGGATSATFVHVSVTPGTHVGPPPVKTKK